MTVEYGIIKATLSLPESVDLLSVQHKNRKLIVRHTPFGPNAYSDNVHYMTNLRYSHSKELPKISFREPTTSESISAATYDFENWVKPKIIDPNWLQLGRLVRKSEGVFVNPPKDARGQTITDEKILKEFLNKGKEVNGIYLCENGFGFAPYDTFTRGVQDYDTFADGGLARLLEHTEERTARNLRKITSPKFYNRGVNVRGFDEDHSNFEGLIPRFAGLGSDYDRGKPRMPWYDYGPKVDDGRLNVGGYSVAHRYTYGYLFGVLNSL